MRFIPNVLRFISPHYQRVGVVESEFTRDAGAICAPVLRDARQRQTLAGVEDFFGDCSGVFRIRTDRAAFERFPQNDCAAHALPMIGTQAFIAQEPCRDLAKHIRFGETLRTDVDLAQPCAAIMRVNDKKNLRKSDNAPPSRERL